MWAIVFEYAEIVGILCLGFGCFMFRIRGCTIIFLLILLARLRQKRRNEQCTFIFVEVNMKERTACTLECLSCPHWRH